MRLTRLAIGLVLLATVAFVSCEGIPEKEKPTTITMQINAGDPETRTQIDGTSALWTVGDRLLVYQAYEPDKIQTTQLVQEQQITEEGTTTDGGRTMAFSVEFDYVDPATVAPEYAEPTHKFKYQAAYPGERAVFMMEDDPDFDYGFGYLAVPLLITQHATQTSFDPNADILSSRQVYLEEQPTTLSLSFKRQTALAQMTLKGLPESAKVNNVWFSWWGPYVPTIFSIDLSTPFPGDEGRWQYMNRNTSDPNPENWWPGWEYNGEDKEDPQYVLIFTPEGIAQYPEGSKKTEVLVSFMTAPFSMTAGDWFYVELYTIENGEWYYYYKEIQLGEGRELVFTAGDRTIFSVDMTWDEDVYRNGPFTEAQIREWNPELFQ